MKIPKWSDFPTAAKVYLILLIPLGLIPLGAFIYYHKTQVLAKHVTIPSSPSPLIVSPAVNERVTQQSHTTYTTKSENASESSTEAPFDYMAALSPLDEEEYEEYPPRMDCCTKTTTRQWNA
jgi:hypothetical protein